MHADCNILRGGRKSLSDMGGAVRQTGARADPVDRHSGANIQVRVPRAMEPDLSLSSDSSDNAALEARHALQRCLKVIAARERRDAGRCAGKYEVAGLQLEQIR
jgi:hypothetical protein